MDRYSVWRKHRSSSRVDCLPERKGKAPVIIIIHEIFGVTDWIRSAADQLAKDGYIAVAPIISPDSVRTAAEPNRSEAGIQWSV